MVWQWQPPAKPAVCNQCQGGSRDLRRGNSGDAALLPWWKSWEHLCGMRRVECRETRSVSYRECPALWRVCWIFWGISFGFGFIFIADSAFFGLALSCLEPAEPNLLVPPWCESAEMVWMEAERVVRDCCVLA